MPPTITAVTALRKVEKIFIILPDPKSINLDDCPVVTVVHKEDWPIPWLFVW
jgi:hypothetical protein